MFSNIFSKASELSKKAKNIANQYLSSQNDPNLPPINEEKVRNMIKEIESLKDYSLKEYEKKANEFQNQAESLKNLNNKLVIELKKVKNDLALHKKALEDNEKKPNFESEFQMLKKKNEELLKEINDLRNTKNEKAEHNQIYHLSETLDNLIKNLDNNNEINEIDENGFKVKFSEYLNKEEFIDLNEEKKDNIKTFTFDLFISISKSENKGFSTTPDNLKVRLEEFKKQIDDEIIDFKDKYINIGREYLEIKEKVLSYEQSIEELQLINNNQKSEKEVILGEKEDLIRKIQSLENQITNLHNDVKKEQDENSEIIKHNKVLETQIQESLIKIKNLESYLSDSKKQEEKLNMRYETIKQSLKNIFFLYLEEDMFMDIIEKCFKLNDINIDEIYRITKFIKMYSTLKVYKYIVNNCIKMRIKNKQFKSFKEINNINLEINNIEQLNSFSEKYIKNEEQSFLLKLFGDIIENNEIQLKAINELSESNKKLVQQLDEANKNDLKVQNDLKESMKTEKYLKDTIENLTNNLNFERSERENIIKSLKQSNEDLDKDTYLLKERLTNITQKCDVYKIENQELIEKYNSKCKELVVEKEKHENTYKEKNALISQINEIDKLKCTLNEKNEVIKNKENEIQKLRISCQNIQNLLEGYKDQHENYKSNFQENLTESTVKYNELEKLYNLQVKETENLINKVKKLENLNEKIGLLESENKRMKDQKNYIKKQADDVMQTLKSEMKDVEYYLDKRIISRFIFKYFDKNSNNNLKIAVLDALANFFGYNNEERKAIGLNPTNFQSSNTSIPGEKIKLLIDVLTNFILNL